MPRDLRRILNPGFLAYEGVPYAIGLAYGTESAVEVMLGAVNQGGDADSIASMAASIIAALHPNTLPQEWVSEVEKSNNLNLAKTALNLVKFLINAH